MLSLHRLCGYKCGVWAPEFEQFEDQELPTEVRDHVGLGQPAEAPTQTIERVERALATLQNIERFACDQHDHVSFAKASMLMSKGIAHALDYDSDWSHRR